MFKENEVASKTTCAGYGSCTEIDISSSHFRYSNNSCQLVLGLFSTQLSSVCAPLIRPCASFIKSSLVPAVLSPILLAGLLDQPPGVPRSQPRGSASKQLPPVPSAARARSYWLGQKTPGEGGRTRLRDHL